MRERGLKFAVSGKNLLGKGRSREGAWIEMSSFAAATADASVAPVRERGLKFRELSKV